MLRSHRLLTTLTLAGLLAGTVTARSVPPAGAGALQTSARDGVFTRAQATRGAKLYGQRCAGCHPIEAFTEEIFLAAWKGQTAHALFTSIRTTMPQENPGGLRRQDYADLVAYLLHLNKLPAGSAELGATDEALKKVVIEPPAKKD